MWHLGDILKGQASLSNLLAEISGDMVGGVSIFVNSLNRANGGEVSQRSNCFEREAHFSSRSIIKPRNIPTSWRSAPVISESWSTVAGP